MRWRTVGRSGLVTMVLAGCVSTSEYEQRTNELRHAQEQTARLGELLRAERAHTTAAKHNRDAAEHRLGEATKRLSELGIHGSSDLPPIRQAILQAEERRQQAERTAADSEQLKRVLREELEAGVVRVEERGAMVRLVVPEEVLFASGSAKLGPPGKKVLERLAQELGRLPLRRLMVSGHTDNRNRARNWALSSQRAVAVTEYLAAMGVNAGRLVASGFAEFDPVSENDSDEGRTRNRRIEITLLPPPDYQPTTTKATGKTPPMKEQPVARPKAPPAAPAKAAATKPAKAQKARMQPAKGDDDPGL